MRQKLNKAISPLFLGIECGGTRTVALLTDAQGRVLRREESGPANFRLITDQQMKTLFAGIARRFDQPVAIGIGMAGVRDDPDHDRILRIAGRIWPRTPCAVSHDLETALAATEGESSRMSEARVIVLSGTGSCCFGRSASGATAKVGGWGHMIGDKGSGYEIGLRAVKAVVHHADIAGHWPALGTRILRALQLNTPNDLIQWALTAKKQEVAALTVELFEAWHAKDPIAKDILAGASHSLARDAVACARRLAPAGASVDFFFTGSVILRQPRFLRMTARTLKKLWPQAHTTPLTTEGAWGAALRARQLIVQHPGEPDSQPSDSIPNPPPAANGTSAKHRPASLPHTIPLPEKPSIPGTEARNPRSMNLDRMPVPEAIDLMIREESLIAKGLRSKQTEIAQAVKMVVTAFRKCGRLFYVGAGTSGRLGVLDASECPPTFRTPPDQVQGIIAGGREALWRSMEGAEDDPRAGREALQARGITSLDVVVGIAASGRTPFVWGALDEARARRSKTVLICFDPNFTCEPARRPDLIIAPDVGPELLTGSTRLKAGTATKLILNMVSTLAMVRLGKVAGNLMIDLNPSNSKLRERAIRIIQDLAQTTPENARKALETSGWVLKKALAALQSGSAPRRPRKAASRGEQTGPADGKTTPGTTRGEY
jgi:N-acetylmuramic acid 6-phosphate etherase